MLQPATADMMQVITILCHLDRKGVVHCLREETGSFIANLDRVLAIYTPPPFVRQCLFLTTIIGKVLVPSVSWVLTAPLQTHRILANPFT